MLGILRDLPGAEWRPLAVNGRDAVSYNGMAIVDTHTLPYLGGCTPDLTLMADGNIVSLEVVLALVELQVGFVWSCECFGYVTDIVSGSGAWGSLAVRLIHACEAWHPS